MASRFPALWLDELRSRTDIIQVVSSYVTLKKNGHRYVGLCPFHSEKTASFSVDQERQLYYCFGCKASGNVFQFIMDIERLEFAEAVKYLADQQHIPLPQMEQDPHWREKQDRKERLLNANRQAARFYHQTLFTPQGEAVMQYLKGRGLSDGVIRKFGLGAAPDSWDALTKHLTAQGYTVEELRDAGLSLIKEAETLQDGTTKPRRVFDMFRSRAMFPIVDQHGNVLGFGGRILGKGQPKYMNTSDTPIYNKRFNVYAANLLRKERNLDRIILVQGYMDVVALTQFGVPGVCASLGTALTAEQVRLLKRFAPKIYLSYDGDSAGQHAILRGLDILEAQGVPARVLDFPDGLDPDEFIRRDGAEGFAKLPSVTPQTYRMRRLREQYDLTTLQGKTDYARECAKLLRKLDPLERENHLKELMLQTGFEREVLLEQIGIPSSSVEKTAAAQTTGRNMKRSSYRAEKDRRDQEILISLLAAGKIPFDIAKEDDFGDETLKYLYRELSGGRSPASILDEQSLDESRNRISGILLSPPCEDTNQMLLMAQECLNTIRRKKLETRILEILKGIDSLEPNAKAEALHEYQILNRELQKLKSGR